MPNLRAELACTLPAISDFSSRRQDHLRPTTAQHVTVHMTAHRTLDLPYRSDI